MASTFKEFVPKEQRMAEAIKAVKSGKLSQRAAALKFDIPRATLCDRIKQVSDFGHPETSQSQPQKPPVAVDAIAKNSERIKQLRQLAKNNGINSVNGQKVHKAGRAAICQALTDTGVPIPENLIPYTFKPKDQKNVTQQQQQRISSDNSFLVISEREDQADPINEHPAFADELDIDAVREHVNREVQRSGRPADFKRAIELLTELDRICTDAWYRRHPEPWGHDDWAHVSSEIEALHSIVGQRAEETADELLRQSSAVEVQSTSVC